MSSVSILMPVYNAELYLSEAIQSMLNQTYTDFELIILDDCSTDNSAAVVHAFSDTRIVYHRNEVNSGLANNLNTGLKLAKGKYIARMDGDDISLPHRLQTQVDFLESHPDIDLCSCAMQMFGADNQLWIRDRDPEQVKITMMFYSAVLHASSVFRRDVFEKNNLYYNQETFPAEDYDLWARAAFYCRMVNLPDVMYLYRMHRTQVTSTDPRSAEKCREIQIRYLSEALPILCEEVVVSFVDGFISHKIRNITEIKDVKNQYLKIIKANISVSFFDQKLLKIRLNKYFQQLVYTFLQQYKIRNFRNLIQYWDVMLELRPQLIVKLFFR
ncbi:MAG: glycosyltransferase family A protein [Paludibacter sp.]|nr:glycosyltransferase family A protein [Paludibacter sp.]